MASELAMEKAAQAWCTVENAHKEMDVELALAFANILDELEYGREEEEERIKNEPSPLDPTLIAFYLKKGYDVCPSCGRGREEMSLTGCPKEGHYGTYCLT